MFDSSPVQSKGKPARNDLLSYETFDDPMTRLHHKSSASPKFAFDDELDAALMQADRRILPADSKYWESQPTAPEETKALPPPRAQTRTNIYKQLFDLFTSDGDEAIVHDVIGKDHTELTRVAEQLKSLPHSKTSLVLDDCYLTTEGILEILQANKDVTSTIKSISFRRTGLTDEMLRSICEFLQDDHLISELM